MGGKKRVRRFDCIPDKMVRMTIKYKYRILFFFKTIDFNDRYDLYIMYDW